VSWPEVRRSPIIHVSWPGSSLTHVAFMAFSLPIRGIHGLVSWSQGGGTPSMHACVRPLVTLIYAWPCQLVTRRGLLVCKSSRNLASWYKLLAGARRAGERLKG
jgi:hypothetical protein